MVSSPIEAWAVSENPSPRILNVPPEAQLTAFCPVAATQFWRSKVLEVAKDFPEYTFAVADEEDFAAEVKDLGLSESGEDVNAAILDESGRKFAMEPEEFDSDTLREFVKSFKKGGLRVAGPPRHLLPLPPRELGGCGVTWRPAVSSVFLHSCRLF